MAIRFSINAHFEGIFGFYLVRRFKTIEKRPLAKTTTKAEAKAEAEIGVQKLVGTSEGLASSPTGIGSASNSHLTTHFP